MLSGSMGRGKRFSAIVIKQIKARRRTSRESSRLRVTGENAHWLAELNWQAELVRIQLGQHMAGKNEQREQKEK